MKRLSNLIKTGWFLSLAQIKRSNIWTTFLIIFIMTLTFLNLSFVSGVLLGLVEGSADAFQRQYSGDVLIKNLENKNFIKNNEGIIKYLNNLNEVEASSSRFISSNLIEANYRTNTSPYDKPDSIYTQVVGINPKDEALVTNLDQRLIEGEYLEKNDVGYVLMGSELLAKYRRVNEPGLGALDDVKIGDKIRIKFEKRSFEYELLGVLKSKNQNVSQRVFMLDSELRKILNRTDYGANEIAVKLKNEDFSKPLVKELKNSQFKDSAEFQTYLDAQGTFFEDIKATFTILSSVIGAIGLMVAAITVFIVIFINAVSRRRFIGILKGIGIDNTAIEIAYIIQALFYSIIGTSIGLFLLLNFIVPFIDKNPIDFPFSDGIVYITTGGLISKAIILFLATLASGYLPIRLITKENTLNAILNRNS